MPFIFWKHYVFERLYLKLQALIQVEASIPTLAKPILYEQVNEPSSLMVLHISLQDLFLVYGLQLSPNLTSIALLLSWYFAIILECNSVLDGHPLPLLFCSL